ncbi:lactate dehydrogenase [Sulfurovum lithotrophicum]|uniref:Lactate dehydrogenase n=1 Tax=Sulfurovum lithotrophicum TaxID=206403 RepID=A0A7U4M0X1_9BACT|nr:NAD(P)-dependent oxidoreductase [Sulfurovum lithotrophicum]AKF24799.1 lactate dehydrogenase [Sulfurovum lithotrophicum]
MKIAFFEIKKEERIFFESHLNGHELFFFEKPIQDIVLQPEEYEAVSVFVGSRITDDILDRLPKLRYLQTRSTGFDHIKCKTLYQKDMKVSNVAGYAGPAVAEFAFSLLLNATRKTHIALDRSKKGDLDYLDLKGIELFGKTIGILGLGTIGLQMAKIAKGFGMKVLGYSRTHKAVFDELEIDFVSLESILENADILMPALPLTPATQGLVNKRNAPLIKKDCIIINTARCEIIEETLYHSLSNIIASDVCSDVSLAQKENFLYTPHMAYYTKEALARIMDISLRNMEQFLNGEIPQNCLKLTCEKEYD